ncbi:MAG TPA: NAD-dependent succinate-semialdehyde dehydrogenase, partial [Gemmatimonadaceae bacterium]|nr:NAD-dependent succinate-semialdehyde dehydrogenase [Gemmatimonadaceae bacterium]
MTIATVNPATGMTLERFEPLGEAGVEQRIARAAAAFHRWRRAPVEQRTDVVGRAAELLDAERDEYAALMTTEMGKLRRAAAEEAAKCAVGCRYYAEHAPRFLADETVVDDGERGYVAYQPLGIVLAVMPWNFPFWQVIRFAAPALCAGNVALLKHASNVPRCALALEALFRRAGAPDGVFQTLLIESAAVEAVIADPRIAAVTLTGSEGAGRAVGSAAGRHIKKSVLELGGSDPFVVMPSAALDDAVATAVRARTINNGQSCIAAKRFIVHERVYDRFARDFVARMERLVVGDPMRDETEVGPLASVSLAEELERQVRESEARGARVLTGGRRLTRAGAFFAPTVLADVPPDAPAYHEEMFGPVASLFRVRDVDDALRVANDTTFGLGAAAWTRDEGEIARFAAELAAGTVFIHGMVASDPRFPFGGVKRSGYGRELAAVGMREFMNVKTVR